MKLFPYYILSDPTSIIQVSGRTGKYLNLRLGNTVRGEALEP